MSLRIDGRPVQALAGDTLLVALLTNGLRVRDSEFGDHPPRSPGPRCTACSRGRRSHGAACA
ncbi:MAG TPA: 2Fe-2S iron-sulfur cluster-binding protein [Burkholderiaceae bacterium]|nr:2Fe-2S iron-sulfur cluster-binding protein [Burkholderiaceae bacterium]